MKTRVEIVTGFLGSGKTTLIQHIMQITAVPREKVIILQWEEGNKKLDGWMESQGRRVLLRRHNPSMEIKPETLRNLLLLHNPHRLIIEHNGSRTIGSLLDVLRDKQVQSLARISTIYHIADAKTVKFFLQNMGEIITSQVCLSDLIILHNTQGISELTWTEVKQFLERLSPEAYYLKVPTIKHLPQALLDQDLLEGGLYKRTRILFENMLMRG